VFSKLHPDEVRGFVHKIALEIAQARKAKQGRKGTAAANAAYESNASYSEGKSSATDVVPMESARSERNSTSAQPCGVRSSVSAEQAANTVRLRDGEASMRAIFKCARSVEGKLPGSDSAKRWTRLGLIGSVLTNGPPFLFVTFSPMCIYHPLWMSFAGFDVKLKLDEVDVIPALADRIKAFAQNPQAEAKFFDILCDLFCKHFFGHDRHQPRPPCFDSIFGKLRNYHGEIEVQRGGRLHVHWTATHLTPLGLEDWKGMAESPCFRNGLRARFMAYLSQLSSECLPVPRTFFSGEENERCTPASCGKCEALVKAELLATICDEAKGFGFAGSPMDTLPDQERKLSVETRFVESSDKRAECKEFVSTLDLEGFWRLMHVLEKDHGNGKLNSFGVMMYEEAIKAVGRHADDASRIIDEESSKH
jgi:hypothetical protein